MLSLFLILSLVHYSIQLYENDTRVEILDYLTIYKEIIRNKYALINFYSNDCKNCKMVADIFTIAATILKEMQNEIFVGVFNCAENVQVARDFDIFGLPNLKFFVRKKPYDYVGNREVLPFVRWVLNIINGGPVLITKSQHLRQIADIDIFSVIGFFKDINGPKCKLFQDITKASEQLSWAIVNDNKIFEEYNLKVHNHIMMLRNFDDPRIDFSGNFTHEEISTFIRAYSVPYLTQFYDRQPKIPNTFDADFPNYFIGFIDSTHKKFTLYKMVFQKAAKLFAGKVKFIYVKVDDHPSHYLLSIVRLEKEEAPTYLFMKLFPDYRTITYRPAISKMTSKRVVDFVNKVLDGTMEPYFRTEKLHQRWNQYPVKVLVGSNYDEVTQDINRTVFVQICSQKCSVCVQMRHVWHSLALFYKDNNNLWIATIDNDKNDISGMRIDIFPMFYYYPIGQQKGIKYEGNRTLNDFKTFLDSEGLIHIRNNYIREDERLIRKAPSYIQSEELIGEIEPDDLKLVLEEL